MRPEYRFIVFDCDGTLLNDRQLVTQKTKDMIAQMSMRGYIIAFASGRSAAGIIKAVHQLDLESYCQYFVCFNGGQIYDVKKKEILFESTISGDNIIPVLRLTKTENVSFYVFDKNGISALTSSSYATEEAEKNNLQVQLITYSDLIKKKHIYKAVAASDEFTLNMFEKKLPDCLRKDFSVTRSARTNLEFTNVTANKGNALHQLSRLTGIALSEMIAFGDSESDIGMIKDAGLGIAMGNSSEILIKAADYITDTNNRDGIAKALRIIAEPSPVAKEN